MQHKRLFEGIAKENNIQNAGAVSERKFCSKFFVPTAVFLDSSAVEHPAVNRRVVGSNPTRGVYVKE